MGRRAIVVGLLICLAWGGLAEAAGKNVRYSGKSGQGKKVVLLTDSGGEAKRFSIHFKAVCGRGFLEDAIQRFVRPLRHADEDGFRDGGTYDHNYSKGRKAEIRTRVAGERAGRGRFEGTFSFKGKYFTAGGEKITTCRTAEIHWSAGR